MESSEEALPLRLSLIIFLLIGLVTSSCAPAFASAKTSFSIPAQVSSGVNPKILSFERPIDNNNQLSNPANQFSWGDTPPSPLIPLITTYGPENFRKRSILSPA